MPAYKPALIMREWLTECRMRIPARRGSLPHLRRTAFVAVQVSTPVGMTPLRKTSGKSNTHYNPLFCEPIGSCYIRFWVKYWRAQLLPSDTITVGVQNTLYIFLLSRSLPLDSWCEIQLGDDSITERLVLE
jgi:hypothetical protein